MTHNQAQYLIETLTALKDGNARIGTKHYTVTITSLELRRLLEELKQLKEEIR
jgi:hypothetical protein